MGNHDTKLRESASLPAENFPSMRLESPEAGWTNQGFSAKRTSSYDNLNQWNGNGYQKSQSKNDNVLEDLFLPVYKQKSEINESHFSVLSVIAKGAFGDVLKVRDIRDNAVYAMKVMQKKKLVAEGAVQQSKDEATIQDAVGYHPLIVKPFWFFQNTSSVFIIMEYIPCGELFTAWKKSGSFREAVVRIYVAELATVVDFLHQSGIIYRDLKMENILLDNRGHLHITDFGLAKRLKRGQRTSTICGTLQYIAPEVVTGKPYGHSSDWWSLGILMYVLLVGQFPLSGMKNHFEMAKQMTGVRYELPVNYSFSPQIQHLVKLLLQTLPERRLSDLNRIKQHAFFAGFNFDGVNQMELKTQGATDSGIVWPNKHTDFIQASDKIRSPKNVTHVPTQKTHSRPKLKWNEPVASLSGLYV